MSISFGDTLASIAAAALGGCSLEHLCHVSCAAHVQYAGTLYTLIATARLLCQKTDQHAAGVRVYSKPLCSSKPVTSTRGSLRRGDCIFSNEPTHTAGMSTLTPCRNGAHHPVPSSR